jgi:hypothetical protein
MLEAGYAAPELAGRANKLTELIIQECANIADRHTYDGDWDIPKMIRQHFGVE